MVYWTNCPNIYILFASTSVLFEGIANVSILNKRRNYNRNIIVQRLYQLAHTSKKMGMISKRLHDYINRACKDLLKLMLKRRQNFRIKFDPSLQKALIKKINNVSAPAAAINPSWLYYLLQSGNKKTGNLLMSLSNSEYYDIKQLILHKSIKLQKNPSSAIARLKLVAKKDLLAIYLILSVQLIHLSIFLSTYLSIS